VPGTPGTLCTVAHVAVRCVLHKGPGVEERTRLAVQPLFGRQVQVYAGDGVASTYLFTPLLAETDDTEGSGECAQEDHTAQHDGDHLEACEERGAWRGSTGRGVVYSACPCHLQHMQRGKHTLHLLLLGRQHFI